jgi:sugar phosphate permease
MSQYVHQTTWVPQIVKRVWDYRVTLVALCTLAFFATMVARLVINPAVPEIVETFDSSPGILGLALAGLWMAYAFAQFPKRYSRDFQRLSRIFDDRTFVEEALSC